MPTALTKEIGWNGVRFRVPHNLEVTSIGSGFLQFSRGETPVMDIKWSRVRGRFSLKRHLRLLRRKFSRADGYSFSLGKTPTDWSEALGKRNVLGFSWQGSATAGEGAIIHCGHCNTATLVQFHRQGKDIHKKLSREVLRSFQDHAEDGLQLLAIFDLKAMLPDRFRLTEHTFRPGRYRLTYADGRERLVLHRIGLADILLASSDLIQWSEKEFSSLIQGFDLEPHSPDPPDEDRVAWRAVRSPGGFMRLLGRATGRPIHGELRIWRAPGRNRLLAVEAAAPRGLDPAMLDAVCASYETV